MFKLHKKIFLLRLKSSDEKAPNGASLGAGELFLAPRGAHDDFNCLSFFLRKNSSGCASGTPTQCVGKP